MAELTSWAKFWMAAGIVAFLAPAAFTIENGFFRFFMLEHPRWMLVAELVAFGCAGAFLREVSKKQARF
jgi:hypothetical protein